MKCFSVAMAAVSLALGLLCSPAAHAQEFRYRQDRMCEILKAKFDTVLPKVMHENHIGMWIVAVREGAVDPNTAMFPPAYIGGHGYYVFTDRGRRIERIAINAVGEELEHCGAFDKVGVRQDIRSFVAARDPKTIAIDVATESGVADGLSHSMYERLVKDLGAPYASRFVSAEQLIAEYRSLQTPVEIAAYSKAAEYSREIADEALSNKVIIPGKTTLRQLSDWVSDQLLKQGLDSVSGPAATIERPGMRSLTITGDTTIESGDLITVEWNVAYLNKWTDVARTAYVLKPGETAPPTGIQSAFNKAVAVRETVARTIKPGSFGSDMLVKVNQVVDAMPGYKTFSLDNLLKNFAASMPQPGDLWTTVLIGCRSPGEFGHSGGAAIVSWPMRGSYVLRPTQALVLHLYTSTPIPEWGGERIAFALEDDIVLTDDGMRFVYPPISHISLVRS